MWRRLSTKKKTGKFIYLKIKLIWLFVIDNKWSYKLESIIVRLGAIGLLWFFVWQLAIHGSPSEHPTITPEEREYIEESIAKLPPAKVKGIK